MMVVVVVITKIRAGHDAVIAMMVMVMVMVMVIVELGQLQRALLSRYPRIIRLEGI